jgi:hypothetical protein
MPARGYSIKTGLRAPVSPVTVWAARRGTLPYILLSHSAEHMVLKGQLQPRIPQPDFVAGPKLALPHLNLQILCARLSRHVKRQKPEGLERLQDIDVVVVAARLREVDAEQQLWHRLEHAWRVHQAAQCLPLEVLRVTARARAKVEVRVEAGVRVRAGAFHSKRLETLSRSRSSLPASQQAVEPATSAVLSIHGSG